MNSTSSMMKFLPARRSPGTCKVAEQIWS